MGEKKIEGTEPLDEMVPRMGVSIETAIKMVDGTVSDSTIRRAIEDKTLKAYKPGKRILILPEDLMLWLKRFPAS